MTELTDEAVKALLDEMTREVICGELDKALAERIGRTLLDARAERDQARADAQAAVALRERAEKAEQERVAEWNRRRDADGSRDAARAACDTMRAELAQARADTDAAVALVVEQCAKGADRRYAAGDMGNPGHHIRALAPADGLAMVQELRAEMDTLAAENASLMAREEGVAMALKGYRATFCHASPGSDTEFALFLEGFDAAADIARALLDARAEIDTTQTQVGDWIVRADEANVKVEKLEAELARVRADAAAAQALVVERAADEINLRRHLLANVQNVVIPKPEELAIYDICEEAIRALAPADGLAAVEALRERAEKAETERDAAVRGRNDWRDDFKALAAAIVGDTGLSAMTVAAQARTFRPRAEKAEADRDRLAAVEALRTERDYWKQMLEKAEECLASANSIKNVIAAERDCLAAENASLKAAKAVAG